MADYEPLPLKVVILQPYVPTYRVPLFNRLAGHIESTGGSLRVVTGSPEAELRQRGDSATGPWHHAVESRSWNTPLGEVKFRRGTTAHLSEADVIVSELDVGNVNTWRLLARYHRPTVVLWGHGKSYVNRERWTSQMARAFEARLADAVMTYAEGGRRNLVAHGVPEDRVVAVGNATDTESLYRWRSRPLKDSAMTSWQREGLDACGSNTALFCGGLDASKRLDFLLEAARIARRSDPEFTLLIGGNGAEADVVAKYEGEGFVHWLRRLDPPALAAVARRVKAIWMPGRVGLIAVDALTLGLPIFTTQHDRHAPEIEFLHQSESVRFLPDDPAEFARESLRIMKVLPIGGAPTPPRISIESVASTMYSTIARAHAGRRR